MVVWKLLNKKLSCFKLFQFEEKTTNFVQTIWNYIIELSLSKKPLKNYAAKNEQGTT